MRTELVSIDVIHDASSIVILPVGNGDSLDVSKKIAGLVQPIDNPSRIP